MRVEVNEDGDFFVILPEDVIDELGLDEGDRLTFRVNSPDEVVLRVA